MYLKRLVRSESEKFRVGISSVYQRRIDWKEFALKTSEILDKVREEARASKLFENLYVDTSLDKKVEHNYVALFFGQHPIGMEFTKNENGSLVIEGGCTLQYSQSPQGYVTCIFFPFSSTQISPKRKHYVYTTYKSPLSIDRCDVEHHVRLMFSIAHYSSCFGNMGVCDWMSLLEIHLNMRWNKLFHEDPIDGALSIVEGVVKKIAESALPSGAGSI